ncbi:restriction endonuclease [Pseudonocardia parietis]|uniref:Restriction system protein n=1 Tax=Pseudonocardia parietis TaxID=570936 RepID=A0ABS4VR99_9PSEU|nr:restriction endonuclease [Pseudonocardia parietis]MBP2366452.1 restriction system protein [Pseudonocardia parietis]
MVDALQPVSEMPTWDGFLLPVLQVLSDGETVQAREVQDRVADHVKLTDAQRDEVLDSGQQRFRNRVGWAVSSLARAGALDRPRRGSYTVTDVGRRLLAEHPHRLDEVDLRQIPAYRDHVPARRVQVPSNNATPVQENQYNSELDPIEQIEAGTARLRAEVSTQLLERLRSASPDFLEQSVLDVLVAMGYGGVEQRARRIGGSGDGGVDGVIDQDPLGLARIYVQAKRYAPDTVVGRPQVQGFVGALHGQQATQGVFITTSTFSREAVEYARSVNASVILINGERFANLMIDRGVGVQEVQTYTIVKLDEDYFE